jgi:epoxyqueuosine reductase
VSRTAGSWLFLGAILTTAVLPPDEPEPDHCGTCRRCLDACPTNAFPRPYALDARRCIAYLTIEHKGHIPREFLRPIGNRVFGCDDCLAVCPWNKFAAAAQEQKFAAQERTDDPQLHDLLAMDEAAFRQRFAGTPVKRTGRDRVVRNALIAAGNSGNPDLIVPCIALLSDPAAIVRAMAVWAVARLAPADVFIGLRVAHNSLEADDRVRLEWALGGDA